ncbi:hypothetical protein ASPZODRAFT_18850 [Penicilliopsis zonata CBS 506.65]|uniref:HPt domain-containing protein n=1 Tax=Penicilliopsis zonata CBS 506.65 TaxID=1073090 RepID=A0A1L9SA74_9EURO|nr:hypothetical protein ASPZODRAFT_18850 [Penicilliopsis zonata CBS 506.65]OJJ44080.1 hypothetical protein ASPZODRAFT_18850 [Penicilliopsis zonata CBS 506.65]
MAHTTTTSATSTSTASTASTASNASNASTSTATPATKPVSKTEPVEEKEKPKPKEGPPTLADFGDRMDQATFEQILEMDDEDDKDFSRGIVFGFFDQADTTFEQMETAIKDKDLLTLSQLGHFLKGSSATLGLNKVRDACEKIQHFGAGKDETGSTDEPDDEKSLGKIKETLKDVKEDYKDVAGLLRRFYGEEE